MRALSPALDMEALKEFGFRHFVRDEALSWPF
jgi:hypothetical protein